MPKSPQQKRSRLQERRIAEDIGGREQPASGASWSAKGDARKTGDLRVEAKFTEKDHYTLKLADLLKIRDEALRGSAEHWAFQVEFTAYRQKWAILDFGLWHHMYMFQAGAGCIWRLQELRTDVKSLRLHATELYQWRTGASSRQEDLVVRIEFITPEKTWVFALVDWDEFIRVREAYGP